MLRDAIAQRAFPAASIAITRAGKLVSLKAFGNFIYEEDRDRRDVHLQNCQNTSSTLFDLASLTKPIATTTMAMILHERGLLELDAPIIGALPEFLLDSSGNADPRRHEVTFRMLLAHSSGLPAYEKLFLQARSREDLLIAALTIPLSSNPGTRAEYSDIGFIILGEALERLAGDPLDSFCQREIFGPLGLSQISFNPSPALRSNIPPTADERTDVRGAGAAAREGQKSQPEPSAGSSELRSTFRNRIIQGEVQDENAYVLGGVAAHAGLFANAEDIARFANMMLQGGAPLLRPETVSLFTQRHTTPGTSRALGWDTPSQPSQSGTHFGPRSYGHLGYTGTSLWIDPDHQLSVTLLTNRTWPDCSKQAIKQVRPTFHNAVVESLERAK